jgi:hypothetical protein
MEQGFEKRALNRQGACREGDGPQLRKLPARRYRLSTHKVIDQRQLLTVFPVRIQTFSGLAAGR